MSEGKHTGWGVKFMVMGREVMLGGDHTMQHVDDAL